MFRKVKKLNMVFLLFILSFLSSCGFIAKHLDSTWEDNRTRYKKSQQLPPLEISPELSGNQHTTTD